VQTSPRDSDQTTFRAPSTKSGPAQRVEKSGEVAAIVAPRNLRESIEVVGIGVHGRDRAFRRRPPSNAGEKPWWDRFYTNVAKIKDR
jgi:hypothetical protein